MHVLNSWVLRVFVAYGLMFSPLAAGAEAPGGWVEKHGAGVRTKLSKEQILGFVPQARGGFTFPPPYHTEAVRITDPSDCPGGTDCLNYVGYSYWRNTNNHTGSDEMLLFLSFDRNKGGVGPTLFRYNKTKGTISKAGPLFDPTSKFSWNTGEGWYFSATRSNTLYVNDGPKMLRYNVISHLFDRVFDVTATWGNDKSIWQMHSSNDDLVHSAALRVQSTGETLGCVVYNEREQRLSFFPKIGVFNECHVDKSGLWLMSIEDIDGRHKDDMRVFDLSNDTEVRRILDQDGAVVHADLGYGYVVGTDNWNALPNASVLWYLGRTVTQGPVVHHNINWNLGIMNHVSHANAKPDAPMNKQFACGSNADHSGVQNEIVCVRLDGANKDLIVAPVMTSLESAGGRTEYGKMPKGNLDITGEYFLWTTNLSGNRLDAFLVKIPSQLLID
jgi:hypothetical protein